MRVKGDEREGGLEAPTASRNCQGGEIGRHYGGGEGRGGAIEGERGIEEKDLRMKMEKEVVWKQEREWEFRRRKDEEEENLRDEK